MDILGLIAVLSFGLTCFALGYSLGKDINKTQKQPPQPSKLSGYHLFNNTGPAVIVGQQYPFFSYSIDGFSENINRFYRFSFGACGCRCFFVLESIKRLDKYYTGNYYNSCTGGI